MAPERGTVDRDLDIAISQFAPGSETVKDKRVYRAAGVTDFFPAGDVVRVRPGYLSAARLVLRSHPAYDVSPMDLFTVIRRPADYI